MRQLYSFSGHLQDYVSDAVGVPIIPSYTPRRYPEDSCKKCYSAAHLDLLDKMTFSERALSFLMHAIGKGFYPGYL